MIMFQVFWTYFRAVTISLFIIFCQQFKISSSQLLWRCLVISAELFWWCHGCHEHYIMFMTQFLSNFTTLESPIKFSLQSRGIILLLVSFTQLAFGICFRKVTEKWWKSHLVSWHRSSLIFFMNEKTLKTKEIFFAQSLALVNFIIIHFTCFFRACCLSVDPWNERQLHS